MDNLRTKKSRKYKKCRENQYTTASVVKTVIRHIIDEIEVAERNRLEQVHNPPKQTVSNDDIDMTGESLAVDNSASFRNLKDFPVVSNELTYSTSTPHYKEQPLADLVADESSLENESNLTKKHSEIQNIVSSYQIIDLNILASTYSAIAYPDCLNRSCIELKKKKKKKKQGLSLQLCSSCTICGFRYSFWTSKKAEKMKVMILINDLYMLFADWEKVMLV